MTKLTFSKSGAVETSSAMDQQTKGESKYERLRKIGIGSYGVVFKCVNRLTGQIVAIKRYSENDTDPVIRKIAMREVRMLRQLKHPNLIYLIEVFRRKRRLHLVFDYCELTVLDVIEKYANNCPLNLIRKIVWQIVNGINYCHNHNCVHRDIKPENILINQSGVVKLCDFGFARTVSNKNGRLVLQNSRANRSGLDEDGKLLEQGKQKDNDRVNEDTGKENQSPDFVKQEERQALTEYVATRWYRAPELLIGDIYYDSKIDIWAIGCVTAELMRGEPIWPGKTDLDQLFMIKSSLGQLTACQTHTLLTQGIYNHLSIERLLDPQQGASSGGESLIRKLPAKVGDSGIGFVAACLQMDPALRPTSGELLRHGYIYSAKMNQFLREAAGDSATSTGSLEPAVSATRVHRHVSQMTPTRKQQQEQLIQSSNPRSNSSLVAKSQSSHYTAEGKRMGGASPSHRNSSIAGNSFASPLALGSTVASTAAAIEHKSLVPVAKNRHGSKGRSSGGQHLAIASRSRKDDKLSSLGSRLPSGNSIVRSTAPNVNYRKRSEPQAGTAASQKSTTSSTCRQMGASNGGTNSSAVNLLNGDSSASSTLSEQNSSFLPQLFLSAKISPKNYHKPHARKTRLVGSPLEGSLPVSKQQKLDQMKL